MVCITPNSLRETILREADEIKKHSYLSYPAPILRLAKADRRLAGRRDLPVLTQVT